MDPIRSLPPSWKGTHQTDAQTGLQKVQLGGHVVPSLRTVLLMIKAHVEWRFNARHVTDTRRYKLNYSIAWCITGGLQLLSIRKGTLFALVKASCLHQYRHLIKSPSPML